MVYFEGGILTSSSGEDYVQTGGTWTEDCHDISSSSTERLKKTRTIRSVLVTGSSGCLGQHVVRLLQEDHPTVREIHLFDTKPYENKLGHRTDKLMKVNVGSVCDADALRKAFANIDAVIHCASLIDVGFFPDTHALEAVNVQGTRNVIDACIEENVPFLVYTGTVSVDEVIEPKAGGPSADHFYAGPYADSKQRAQELVLAANGRVLADGRTEMHSVVLRQLPLYGEQDQVLVTQLLRISRRTMNTLFKIGKGFQTMYAGNAAAAHLRALDALASNEEVSGRIITVTDDTPREMYEFVKPIMESRGCRVSTFTLPYYVALLGTILIAILLIFVRPFYRAWMPMPTPAAVTYACRVPVFDGSEGRLQLSYRPPYTVQESLQRSLLYYSTVEL